MKKDTRTKSLKTYILLGAIGGFLFSLIRLGFYLDSLTTENLTFLSTFPDLIRDPELIFTSKRTYIATGAGIMLGALIHRASLYE